MSSPPARLRWHAALAYALLGPPVRDLREIFRFLPRVGAMRPAARTIFLWRAAQLTVLPVLVALGALGTVVAWSHALLPGLALLPAAAAVLLGRGVARTTSPLVVIAHGALLSLATLAALVAYPFTRQTAALPKIPPGGRCGA